MNPFEVITFDCYGTLIDWEKGIRDAFSRVGLESDAALKAYAQIEPVVEVESYRSYHEVLTETAARVVKKLGNRSVRPSFLADSLPAWKPFVDTNPALERLRRAAGALLQAGARSLREGAGAHRYPALAARGPKQPSRHRARQSARHRKRVDQPARAESAGRWRSDVSIPRSHRACGRDGVIRMSSGNRSTV